MEITVGYNGDSKIVEIDDKYYDCISKDFDGFEFNVEKYNARKQKEFEDTKLERLTNWFDTTYRYKHEKYTRLIALNKLDDDGVDASEKLLSLYEEAEDVRRQIQELEEELNNGN